MNGSTFPGRMISSAGTVCFGETTDTAGRAAWAVSARRAVPALTRDQIPETRRAATAIAAIARTSHDLRESFRALTSFNESACWLVGCLSSVWIIKTPHTLGCLAHWFLG